MESTTTVIAYISQQIEALLQFFFKCQFQPLFIHIVSYVVKIYICHLALKS